jgi:hypothetical protein
MQHLVFFCIISYLVTPGNIKSYYIQPGRTIGYKSNVNLPTVRPGIRLIPEADPKRRHRRRGRQSSQLVRLLGRAHRPSLQSILLTNVQSLDNKVDEIQARVAFQRDISDCSILCFTETWLSLDILSESVQPPGFSMHHADRDKHLSGKRKGGGVCFMINDSWCNHNNIQELKYFCSPDLDFLTIKC